MQIEMPRTGIDTHIFPTSSTKLSWGGIDTQEILLHGELRDGEWKDIPYEWDRIIALCEWGKPFGIDGFIRWVLDIKFYRDQVMTTSRALMNRP